MQITDVKNAIVGKKVVFNEGKEGKVVRLLNNFSYKEPYSVGIVVETDEFNDEGKFKQYIFANLVNLPEDEEERKAFDYYTNTLDKVELA